MQSTKRAAEYENKRTDRPQIGTGGEKEQASPYYSTDKRPETVERKAQIGSRSPIYREASKVSFPSMVSRCADNPHLPCLSLSLRARGGIAITHQRTTTQTPGPGEKEGDQVTRISPDGTGPKDQIGRRMSRNIVLSCGREA